MVNFQDENEVFEKINSELVQHRNFLKLLFLFSTFEIIKYEKYDEYELVTFDLAAQNTGNIFTYKYYFEIGEYRLCDFALFSYIGSEKFSGFKNEILDEVFNIARTNTEQIINKKRLKR